MFTLPSNRNMKIKDLTFDNRGTHSVIMLGFGDMAIPEILIVSSAIYNPLLWEWVCNRAFWII